MKKFVAFSMAVLMMFAVTAHAMAANFQQTLGDVSVSQALDTLEQQYVLIYGDGPESALAGRLINCYRSDPQFFAHFEGDPEDAIGMVARVVGDAIEIISLPQPLWTDGSIFSADGVPNYQQRQNNSCGTASALQVIIQQGGSNNVAGATYAAKEQTLINQTAINTNGSVLVYEVRNLINNYTSKNTYAYIACGNMNAADFRTLVLRSITKDCPVILHANTKYLGYYNSNAWGHYIVGTTFFALTEEFVVNDCNYLSQYAGIRSTTMTEAYNSVHNLNSDGSSRYLIYGT